MPVVVLTEPNLTMSKGHSSSDMAIAPYSQTGSLSQKIITLATVNESPGLACYVWLFVMSCV